VGGGTHCLRGPRLRLDASRSDPRVHCLLFRRQTARDVRTKDGARVRAGVREVGGGGGRGEAQEKTGRGAYAAADTFHSREEEGGKNPG